MSETTEVKAEDAVTESPFAAILADTGQPQAVTDMIEKTLTGLFELVARHNSRVLRIQQTRAADANDESVLDALWTTRTNANQAPAEILEIEKNYQAVVEEMMKLKDKLRAWAKTQIQPPLTPEQVEIERKAANEEAKLIEDEKARAAAFADIADQYLTIAGKAIDGGVLSLIPEVQSIKGGRGRKSMGGISEGRQYRTRIDTVEMDGVVVTKGGKSNFIIAADVLNEKWNAKKLTDNAIDDETLERRMYEAYNASFRDSAALPEVVEFDFTRDIEVQNPNDEKTTKIPQTVKFKVTRNVRAKSTDTENKSDDSAKPETEKPAEKPAEENKAEAIEKANEPAKVNEDTKANENLPRVPQGPATAALSAKQKAMQDRANANKN
jgi:hypothetical protein